MSAVVSRASRLLGRGRAVADAVPKVADAAAILGALPVPVILLDSENRFRHANHAAEQFLGISAAWLAQRRLRMRDFIDGLRTRVVPVDTIRQYGDPDRLLANVNTPAEYAGLEALQGHEL